MPIADIGAVGCVNAIDDAVVHEILRELFVRVESLLDKLDRLR